MSTPNDGEPRSRAHPERHVLAVGILRWSFGMCTCAERPRAGRFTRAVVPDHQPTPLRHGCRQPDSQWDERYWREDVCG